MIRRRPVVGRMAASVGLVVALTACSGSEPSGTVSRGMPTEAPGVATPGGPAASPGSRPSAASPTGSADGSPDASPVGAEPGDVPVGRIVFDSDRGDSIDIWYQAAGSADPVQVTSDPATDRVAAWGPDGRSVIFSSDRTRGPDSPSGLRAYALWVAELDGSGERHLLGTRTFNHGAQYSPDGSTIVFYSDPEGLTQIHVMPADGSGQPRALTDHAGGASGPSWSPDGTEILFSSYRSGNSDVYIMRADGSDLRQLIDDPATDWAGSWSPDGSEVVFSSDRDGDSEIYLMDAAGGNVRQLTDDPGRDAQPTWSPDGAWIAFSSNRDGNSEIYVIRPDGSDLTNVTNHPARDDFPSWGP